MRMLITSQFKKGKKQNIGEDGVMLGNSFPIGHLVPRQEAIAYEGTVISGSEAMPFQTKVIQDRPKC